MPNTYIQFKSFNDFVRFITISPTPFIHHVKLNGNDLYFVHITALGNMVSYYVKMDKEIDEKYVIYNRFRDTISFSNKIESDGQSICVPILEVESTNVFQDHPTI